MYERVCHASACDGPQTSSKEAWTRVGPGIALVLPGPIGFVLRGPRCTWSCGEILDFAAKS
jgi:hypothetical protein